MCSHGWPNNGTFHFTTVIKNNLWKRRERYLVGKYTVVVVFNCLSPLTYWIKFLVNAAIVDKYDKLFFLPIGNIGRNSRCYSAWGGDSASSALTILSKQNWHYPPPHTGTMLYLSDAGTECYIDGLVSGVQMPQVFNFFSLHPFFSEGIKLCRHPPHHWLFAWSSTLEMGTDQEN